MSPFAVGPQGAPSLAALHAQAFEHPWTASAFVELLASPGVFALAVGDDGFILVRRVLDEAEVLTLAVRPARRRSGVGRTLVEAAAAVAAQAGAEAVWLEVAEDNAAAIALYAGCRFTPAGRRRGYYARTGAPAADALVLRLDLKAPA